MKQSVNYLVLLIVTLLWGGSFIAIKYNVLVWPPFFSAMLRMLICFSTLRIFLFFSKKNPHIDFRLRWRIWIIGIFSLGVPFCSLFWGERFIAPGLAGIINATTLIWSFLFCLLLFHQERQNLLLKLLGVVIGFVGIIIIFWPMLSFQQTRLELIGACSVLLMALSYAVGSVLNQYFFSTYGSINLYTNLYHQSWGAWFFAMMLTLIFEPWPHWQMITSQHAAIFGSIYLGVFSTAIGWALYYYLIRTWGAVRASLTAYLVPITALLDDYLFFRHLPKASELIGVLVILLAILLINSNKKATS